MSEQLKYQLKRVALLAVLAALGIISQNLGQLQIDPRYAFVVAAVVAALIQIVQGFADTARARNGDVQPQDVGYAKVQMLGRLTRDQATDLALAKDQVATLSERNRDLAESYADSEYRLSKFQSGEIPHVTPPAAAPAAGVMPV